MNSEQAWAELLRLGDAADDAFDDEAAEKLVHLLHQRGEPIVVDWALPALKVMPTANSIAIRARRR